MKNLILILCAALTVTALTGCTYTAAETRAALDECSANGLDNIVFACADQTVVGVECTPAATEINNAVTVKPPFREIVKAAVSCVR
ncbi:hypothetical protein ACQ9AT_00545 [Klebsiella pneumoniae]|nr:hypothetical protein [Klebsiella pneumoniae]